MLRSARATTYRQVSIRLGGLPAVQDLASAQGLGVSGMVDGHAVAAGLTGWLTENPSGRGTSWLGSPPGPKPPGRPAGPPFSRAGTGRTAVLVIADTIKPASADRQGGKRGPDQPQPPPLPVLASARPRRSSSHRRK
jgi:cation transport ATPase